MTVPNRRPQRGRPLLTTGGGKEGRARLRMRLADHLHEILKVWRLLLGRQPRLAGVGKRVVRVRMWGMCDVDGYCAMGEGYGRKT